MTKYIYYLAVIAVLLTPLAGKIVAGLFVGKILYEVAKDIKEKRGALKVKESKLSERLQHSKIK